MSQTYQLNSLIDRKAKLGKKSYETHNAISSAIEALKEKINQDKVKLKIKFKIQHLADKH